MIAREVRVLFAEDSIEDAELESRALTNAGLHIAKMVTATPQSFAAALGEFAPDVILADFSMPGFGGFQAVEIAREIAPEVPFIFVSGTIGEENAIAALKRGASDYVLKSNLARLPGAVERALAEARERREMRATSLSRLSPREREVLKLVVEGSTSKEIAAAIGVKPASVDTYRSRIMAKLEIGDIASLVRYAIRQGLIRP